MKLSKTLVITLLSLIGRTAIPFQSAQIIQNLAPQSSFFERIKTKINRGLTHLNYQLCNTHETLGHFDHPQEIESALRTIEHDALIQVKNAFTISDNAWNEQMALIHETKKQMLLLLKNPRAQFFHDTQIPEATRELITTLLTAYNIHPEAVNITILSDNKEYNTVAMSKAPLNLEEPAEIVLNVAYFEALSFEEQAMTIIHEITHLLEGHTYFNTLLTLLIHKKTKISYAQIAEHPDFLAYQRTQELLASTLLATADKDIANIVFAGIQKRYEKFGPGSIAPTHSTPIQDYTWSNAIQLCHQKANNLC